MVFEAEKNKQLGFGAKQFVAKNMPLRERIRCMFWDVDGTLFKKTPEIEREQKWLAYNAFALCRDPKRDSNPFRIRQNAVFPTREAVPEEIVTAYESLILDKRTNPNGRYGSNGHMFMGEFGKDQTYWPKIMSTVDYGKLLKRDDELARMFAELTGVHRIPQRVLTNEVAETVDHVFVPLGLDVGLFRDFRIDEMFPLRPELTADRQDNGKVGVLCAYNMRDKKPSLEVFRQILEVTGLSGEPDRVMYIGDSESKDVIPPKQLGMTAVLAWSEAKDSAADFVLRTVYQVAELFRK